MTERQSRWLLVLVLGAQLVLLSAQAPGREGDQNLLETLSLRAVAPVAYLVASGSNAVGSFREGVTTRSQLREENERLREEIEALEEERIRHFGVAGRLERLEEALKYESPASGGVRAADVVHVDYGTWFQTLILYTGEERARVQQPVVTSEGLLGRVVVVSGPYAKVQLITDRAASVGAMNERTRRQGLARGGAQGMLELDFVPLQADVMVGDRIVTAGIDGVFPRGVPIGRVVSVEPGNELFHRIQIRPEVDLGRLDQVYLLDSEVIPEQLVESTDARP